MPDIVFKCETCGANRLQAVGATGFQKASAIVAILAGGAVLLIAALQGEELTTVMKLGCVSFIGDVPCFASGQGVNE